MPRLISREDALAAIAKEGKPECLMCALVERAVGPVYAVYEDDEALVMLPRYVRSWGSMMVIPKLHVTTYREVPRELWARMNSLALQAAHVAEAVHDPRRCYVASIGSNPGEEELPQSSKHLHLHVIPVHDPQTRPADVFTWSDGVYVAEPTEWEAARDAYVRVWDELGGIPR